MALNAAAARARDCSGGAPWQDAKELQELWTNYVGACIAGNVPVKDRPAHIDTHELALNCSIKALASGNTAEAAELAQKAEGQNASIPPLVVVRRRRE